MIFFYYNLSISIIFILSSFALTVSIFKKNNEDIHIGILIFTWHLFFTLIHFYYSLFFNHSSDSYNYYYQTIGNSYTREGDLRNWFSLNLLSAGSNFLKNIVFLFNNFFLFSYFNVFLIFSIIGNFGLIFLYLLLKKISSKNLSIIILSLILIPSMSFWTSSISKDAINFFASCYFLWSFVNEKKINYNKTFFSFFLIYLVRPHVAIIFLLSIMLGILFKSKKNIFEYIIIILSIISIPIVLWEIKRVSGYSLDFSSISNFSNSFFDLIEYRYELNRNIDTMIDYDSLNIFGKIFTYYFRPLPIDTNNMFQLIISIENLYFLSISFILILNMFYKFYYNKIHLLESFKKFNYGFFIIIIYVLTLSFLLSQVTSNLGISSRQKYMLIPFIYFSIFYLLSIRKEK